MKTLSNLEASLLMSVQLHPNQNEVYHATKLFAKVLDISRACRSLKDLGYVNADTSTGRLTLNQSTVDRINTEIMHTENSSGVVHRLDKVEDAVKISPKLPQFPSLDSIMQQLTEAGRKGMSASDMAKPYGCKGTSLVQILIRLRDDGKITKNGTQWFVTKEEDAVTHIHVPVEQRRKLESAGELTALISSKQGWFTAKEMYETLSGAFIIDWLFFYDQFMEMAGEGHFNVKENGVLVSYEHSYAAENKHANCRWDGTVQDPKKFNKVMQDYIYLVQQGGKQHWSLEHCVEITKIQSGLLLHWFELAGFDTTDKNAIGAKVSEYTAFDHLDSEKVQEFIGAEGCRATAFIKAFNLDPSTTDKICSLLELVGVARYDAENKYLMLPQTKKTEESLSEYEQRVTRDSETDEATEVQEHSTEQTVVVECTSDKLEAVEGDLVITEKQDAYTDAPEKEVEDVLDELDGDPEAEEYAARMEPHLDHLLQKLADTPTKEYIQNVVKETFFDMFKGHEDKCTMDDAGPTGPDKCDTPKGAQTVKPEWVSGLAIIADQYKRSSATRKLLLEIKEYLEK